MKHPLLLPALAILAAILLFACSSDSDDISSQKFKVDISGTVMNSKTKVVLGGVTVELLSNGIAVTYKVSDINGAFAFDDLDAGTYKLRVNYTGYEGYEEEAEVRSKGYKLTISLEPSATTFLTIENKSSFVLENVVWNGVEFGAMEVNAAPVRRQVSAGNAYVTFYVPSRELNLKTSVLVAVVQDTDAAYLITDMLSVEEISNDNQAVLSSIKKIQAPQADKVSVTDTSYASAKLNSRIIEAGNPEFTERGFCYSKYLAELELSVNCFAIEGGDFSKAINDLDDAVKYYVKAYMENSRHGRQFSEPDSFVTKSGAPIASSPIHSSVSYNTATVQSNIVFAGYPSYANNGGERGFCYGIYSDPKKGAVNTICKTVAGTGSNFLLAVADLEDSTKYYVRSYIENGKHAIQYSDTVSFTTLSGIPSVSIGTVTNVSYNTATLNSSVLKQGVPGYTERGFCYGVYSDPKKGAVNTICETVAGTGSNFQLAIENLEDGNRYRVRSYIENGKHAIQYSEIVSFDTPSGLPTVSSPIVSSIGYDRATLQANITFPGYPSYLENGGERGFCVWTNEAELNYHCYEIEGTSANFLTTDSSFKDNTRYYVKAYIDNGKQMVYSSTVNFTTLDGKPSVRIDATTGVTSTSAVLQGTIINDGYPAASEKGFCYSQTSNLPAKGNTSSTCTAVSGTSEGFELSISSLQGATTYYIRAYIENLSYGTVYSTTKSFMTKFKDSRNNKEYVVKDIGNGIIWFFEDLNNGKSLYTWTEAQTACPSGWHLPNNNEWDNLEYLWAENTDFTATSDALWWSASPNGNSAYLYYIYYGSYGSYVRSTTDLKTKISPVRCVKN